MQPRLTRRELAVLAALSPVALAAGARAQSDAGGAPLPSAEVGAREQAIKAYIFAYPLVTMEMTRRVLTNVAGVGEGLAAPMGQFKSLRSYPSSTDRQVTAPNADTLYSTAFVDLGHEPMVLTIPQMGDRYYLMPMLEAWTNVFADPGKRTGTRAGNFAIAGPGWRGRLPEGVRLLRSSTDMAWILGRIYCTGTKEDYAAVHALQDKLKLTPLSAWGKPYTPPPGKVDPSIDMKTPVRDQVERMDLVSFLTLAAELMKTNPPYAADTPALVGFERIGLVEGRSFDAAKLGGASWVADVPKLAIERISGHFHSAGVDLNGWVFARPTGRYGTDYIQRALITRFGLGANLPEDAVYPTARTDAKGEALNGANRYVVRFPKGQLPPANGFWSMTMYDDQWFFVANKLNRYTLSQRDALKQNPDGSTDLLIQADDPGGDKTSNWLPAPRGAFILMLRLYWPKEGRPSILDGTWNIPPVQKA